MIELARLLEDYAAAHNDFLRAHADDYASKECADAYVRQESIHESLTDEFEDLLAEHATSLAAAIRSANGVKKLYLTAEDRHFLKNAMLTFRENCGELWDDDTKRHSDALIQLLVAGLPDDN